MHTFGEIEVQKKKKKDNYKRKSFGTTTTKHNPSGGGATAASVQGVIDRVNTLESNQTIGVIPPDIFNRLSALENLVGYTEANVVSLDTALSLKADAIHNHDGLYLTETELQTLVQNMLDGLMDPDTTDSTPLIASGAHGSLYTYTKTWCDSFNDSSAETLFNRWHPDLMTEGLHKAGNNGRDNWRWAANYSKPQETAFIKDNALHMRAYVETVYNPYRTPYEYDGVTYHPENNVIYLAFLSTWKRRWEDSVGHHITDPAAPNRTWGPGTVFEFTVSFEEMRTQACRTSFYLLPANENDSSAYNPDGTRGVEIDAPEIDFLDGYENYAQSKVISSAAGGNTPAGSIDLNTLISDLDLQAGTHVFTFMWEKDRLTWYVNGVQYKVDTDPRRIPLTPHYLVISREANSGMRAARPDGQTNVGGIPYSDGTPEQPTDVGIWGRPVYKEIDRLNNDTAKIHSVATYAFNDTSTAGVGVGNDTDGVPPTITSGNPPTSWATNTPIDITWTDTSGTISNYYIEVGSFRGGRDLGSASMVVPQSSYTINTDFAYNGPVNARIWFRNSSNDIWNYRDYGFSSGLQPYAIGTDGKILNTVSDGSYVGSVPTVTLTSSGTDGTYANGLDYSAGVVPAGYGTGYTATPTATLTGGQRYSSTAGEIMWEKGDLTDFSVLRDGVLVTPVTSNGASYYDNTLDPGVAYVYEVFGTSADVPSYSLGTITIPAANGPGVIS